MATWGNNKNNLPNNSIYYPFSKWIYKAYIWIQSLYDVLDNNVDTWCGDDDDNDYDNYNNGRHICIRHLHNRIINKT